VLEDLKILITEGRSLTSIRAVKLRGTLRLKGKKHSIVARRSPKTGKVAIRLKTGKDVLRNKIKVLRNKHNPLAKHKKSARAAKLYGRGINH
jgi:hypothetical protein